MPSAACDFLRRLGTPCIMLHYSAFIDDEDNWWEHMSVLDIVSEFFSFFSGTSGVRSSPIEPHGAMPLLGDLRRCQAWTRRCWAGSSREGPLIGQPVDYRRGEGVTQSTWMKRSSSTGCLRFLTAIIIIDGCGNQSSFIHNLGSWWII